MVSPIDERALLRDLRAVGPNPAPDVAPLLAAVPRELHHLRHPRLVETVAIALDLEKPFERVRLRTARGLGADRIVVPLILDLILVRIAGVHVARIAVMRQFRRERP